uniref:Putative secreted protein n=1 Tax=Anopheles darlingi TaxID=43151 RepID=A0A2M4DET5_ANODA
MSGWKVDGCLLLRWQYVLLTPVVGDTIPAKQHSGNALILFRFLGSVDTIDDDDTRDTLAAGCSVLSAC